MTATQLKILRQQIERHRYLWINDEASGDSGFAVHDRRDGLNFGMWIANADSLKFLVKHGAEAWLESAHNGMGKRS